MTRQKQLIKLKVIVYLMVLLGIVTFLSGFLKYTVLEHVTLLLMVLLFLGGIKLVQGAKNTVTSGYSKFFLILTGISTLAFIILIVAAIVMTLLSEVSLSDNLEILEGLFYLGSLLFLIGVIGCIIFLNIKEGRNSTQP